MKPLYPIACCASICCWISSLCAVAARPAILSCTWIFLYSHWPCVASSSLVISPSVHRIPVVHDPQEIVFSSYNCWASLQIIPSMNRLQPISSCDVAILLNFVPYPMSMQISVMVIFPLPWRSGKWICARWVLFVLISSNDPWIWWWIKALLLFLRVGMIRRVQLFWLLGGSLGIWGSLYWMC